MQVRDGPAAVRGDAPAPNCHWPPGREGGTGGRPSQKTCRVAATRTPRGRRIRVSTFRHPGRGSDPDRRTERGRHVRRRSASKVSRGRSSVPPTRASTATQRARCPEDAGKAGEFFVHVTPTSYGPYVDQVGYYAAFGSSGWTYKVNGVSPPVGADQYALEPGDRCSGTGRSSGCREGRRRWSSHRAQRGLLPGLLPRDTGAKTAALGAALHVDGRSVKTQGRRRRRSRASARTAGSSGRH